MCSFDGFFINITEEQLNQQPTNEESINPHTKRVGEPNTFQQVLPKRHGSPRSSMQSLSGRSRGSTKQRGTFAKAVLPPSAMPSVAKKPTVAKRAIKLQNLNQAVMILQKNQIQLTESRSRAQISDRNNSPSGSDRSEARKHHLPNKKPHLV